ncbi:MAPEG family protein [Qipengyuania sp. DGS5-3]|uniref:MAPEG family protein n=1 Tax=Qipengyuania sp. DGS5-3 TaxID=3349632 RepID=UPI0036D34D24
MQAQMLAPAAVLALWSMIMLWWMAGTRFPALAKADRSKAPKKDGVRGRDLEGWLPEKVMWKAHNYDHLMEQPTVFYAAVIVLAIMGPEALDVTLAWTYVAVRILHSFWQALINKVNVRIILFSISSIALTILAIRAVSATLFFDPGLAPS